MSLSRVARPVCAGLVFLTAAPVSSQEINASIVAAEPDTEAQAARRKTQIADALAKVRGAVAFVSIEVRAEPKFRIERPSTGVIVDPSGLVVTHWSLVREAHGATDKTVFVEVEGREEMAAKIVAHDEKLDLALLAIDEPSIGLPFCELADSSGMLVGEPAAVVGYPDGEDHVVFAGIALRPSGATTIGARELSTDEFVLTTAAIQDRCASAALVDAAGRLLGLCNASNVLRAVREPTTADLKKPSFGVAIAADTIRKVFRREFQSRKPKNSTLLRPPPGIDAIRSRGTADAVAAVRNGIVTVRAGDDPKKLGLKDPFAVQRRKHIGSGFIVDTTGLVLTNAHIVGSENDVRVRLFGGKKDYSATLLAKKGNIALLKVDFRGKKVEPLVWGSVESAMQGEAVLAIGNPEGTALTVSEGVLSAIRDRQVQTDAQTDSRNGGGPLVDLSGRVLGIVDAGAFDPWEMEAAMRGTDEVKTETGLNDVPHVDWLRKAFGADLDEHAGSNESTAKAPEVAPADRELRHTPIVDLVERTRSALLNVYVKVPTAPVADDNPFGAFAAPTRTATRGLGSGVVIDASGLALTNWHVVDSATHSNGEMKAGYEVTVSTGDGTRYNTRVLSTSREDDLALIQLEIPEGESVNFVKLGNSEELTVGEAAIAIGNPHGRANTVTAGVVAAKNKKINVKGRATKLPSLMETDAQINGGNSGGALLDINGRLIGINSAGGSGRNVTGFAIAVDAVREKLRSLLLTTDKLRSAHLGFTVLDSDGKVYVHAVDRFGPGKRAGVQKDDVVVAVEGQALRWSVDLAHALLEHRDKDRISLTVRRGGANKTIAIAPQSAVVRQVYRQMRFEGSNTTDAAQVRAAAIAVERAITEDPNAVPLDFPVSMPRVDRVHPSVEALKAGDLILAIKTLDGWKRFTQLEQLENYVNNNSVYDTGVEFDCLLYRGGKAVRVEVNGKRLRYGRRWQE